jgi:hypothetical protein
MTTRNLDYLFRPEAAAGSSERQRLALLVERDGVDAAAAWARRTLRIYRRAVLSPGHFARLPEYRRRFVEAYCELKRWLARAPGAERGTAPTRRG